MDGNHGVRPALGRNGAGSAEANADTGGSSAAKQNTPVSFTVTPSSVELPRATSKPCRRVAVRVARCALMGRTSLSVHPCRQTYMRCVEGCRGHSCAKCSAHEFSGFSVCG